MFWAVCPGGVQSLGKIGGKEACALRGTYKGMDMLITSDNCGFCKEVFLLAETIKTMFV